MYHRVCVSSCLCHCIIVTVCYCIIVFHLCLCVVNNQTITFTAFSLQNSEVLLFSVIYR